MIDSLRWDFLSTSDSDTNEQANKIDTPGFERIADRGTVFENAYSAGPATTISHASMFSGQYPSETGVALSKKEIPAGTPLIAEQFRQAGYETLGLAGLGKISSDFGFARGFDEYIETYREQPDSILSTEYVRTMLNNPLFRIPMAKHFLKVIRRGGGQAFFKFSLMQNYIERKLEKPFFIFGNIPTVHRRWEAPRPFKRRTTPELNRSRLYLTEKLLNITESLDRDDVRLDRVRAAMGNEGIARYQADSDWLTDSEIKNP